MDIKIKLIHRDAVIPKHSVRTDTGLDLVVTGIRKIGWFKVEYDFGIAVEPPTGYYFTLNSRSSIMKRGMILSNSVGIIDQGYRDNLKAVMYYIPLLSNLYNIGERAAQIILHKKIHVSFKVHQKLSSSERKGGYGSTGK